MLPRGELNPHHHLRHSRHLLDALQTGRPASETYPVRGGFYATGNLLPVELLMQKRSYSCSSIHLYSWKRLLMPHLL